MQVFSIRHSNFQSVFLVRKLYGIARVLRAFLGYNFVVIAGSGKGNNKDRVSKRVNRVVRSFPTTNIYQHFYFQGPKGGFASRRYHVSRGIFYFTQVGVCAFGVGSNAYNVGVFMDRFTFMVTIRYMYVVYLGSDGIGRVHAYASFFIQHGPSPSVPI